LKFSTTDRKTHTDTQNETSNYTQDYNKATRLITAEIITMK